MTDIELGGNVDERVTFKCYDFAGQKEYSHTHMLFFNKNALFCVVHNPLHGAVTSDSSDDSLDEYLEMIANTAQNTDIILVTTRCKEEGAVVSEEFISRLKTSHPHINISDVVAVDSSDGTGYDKLEEILVSRSLRKSNTRKEIPASYLRIQLEIIDKFALDDKLFSVSKEEMNRLIKEQLHLDIDIDMAMDQFSQSGWGNTYILSNGDICIRPQQLADIMSDVITANDQKKETFSHSSLGKGILEHSNEIFKTIWGNINYAEGYTLRDTDANLVPPFVQLLYDSCLAYRLYSEDGPMPYSLIPALLPALPSDVNPKFVFEQYFKVNSGSLFDLGSIVMTISPFVPVPLIPRLQVALQNQSVIGGNFKQGCVTTDRDESYSIVYCKDKKHIEVCTYGKSRASTGIISIVLATLKELLDTTFHQCTVSDLRYELLGVVYDQNMLTSAYASSKRLTLDHRVGSEVVKLNILPLLVFLGVDLSADDDETEQSSIESAAGLLPAASYDMHPDKNMRMNMQKGKSFKRATSTLSELTQRIQSVCDRSSETASSAELYISLFKSMEKDSLLRSIMNELGLAVNTEGIRSLWLPLQHMETASIRLTPLTPRNPNFTDGAEFIDSKYIEIPSSLWTDAASDCDDDVGNECVSIIEKCLDGLLVRVPKKCILLPLRNIALREKSLKFDVDDLQRELFGQSLGLKLPLVADKFSKTRNMVADNPVLVELVAVVQSMKSKVTRIDITLKQMRDEIKAIIPAIYAVSDRYKFPKRILLTAEKIVSSAPRDEKSLLANMFDFFNHTSQVLTHSLAAVTHALTLVTPLLVCQRLRRG